jgi:hypothetical protein
MEKRGKCILVDRISCAGMGKNYPAGFSSHMSQKTIEETEWIFLDFLTGFE